MNTKLFVGNLGAEFTENDLREAFAPHGNIVEAQVVRDRATGQSRGFGFVTLSSGDERQRDAIIVKFYNMLFTFKGRQLIVREAHPDEEWYEEPLRDIGLTVQQWDMVAGKEKLLVERGLVRAGQNPRLQALLWWVLDFGRLSQLEKVLAAGANPNIVFTRLDTPLGKVATWSDHPADPTGRCLKAFRLLLNAGADPNVPSEKKSLVALAEYYGMSDIIEVLSEVLEVGKVTLRHLGSALLSAAAKGDLPLVERLLAKGISPDPEGAGQPGNSQSPLMLAAFGGHREIVERLLAAGADVNRKDIEGHTALDYAHSNRSAARKTIPVLVKAGAVSGKSFQRDDEATRGFSSASKKPAFKEALAKVKQLTGVSRRKLEGEEAEIHGGYGFLVPEERARTLVEEHHAEFLAAGAYLFFTRDLTDANGDAVALLPTNDVYRAIAAVGTEGPNSDVYNADLIAWLRDLEKEQPFSITGIGRDFIEGKFTTPIKDPAAIVKRINKLCPDGDEGPEIGSKQVQELQRTGRLYLWWD